MFGRVARTDIDRLAVLDEPLVTKPRGAGNGGLGAVDLLPAIAAGVLDIVLASAEPGEDAVLGPEDVAAGLGDQAGQGDAGRPGALSKVSSTP